MRRTVIVIALIVSGCGGEKAAEKATGNKALPAPAAPIAVTTDTPSPTMPPALPVPMADDEIPAPPVPAVPRPR